MKEIKGTQEESNELRKQVDKLAKKAHVHSGNIPGTQQYMKSTYHEFKATTLYTGHATSAETLAAGAGQRQPLVLPATTAN